MQENPFLDLVPPENRAKLAASWQSQSAQQVDPLANNPFADLIPGNPAYKGTPSKTQQLMSGLTNETSPLNLVLGAGDSVANQMRNVVNLLPGVNLRPIVPKSQGTAYDAGQLAGDIGGFLAGGAELDALRGAAEGLPMIGKTAQYLGGTSLAPTMARLASGSALHGAIMNPDDRTQGAIIEGLLGGAAGAVGKGIENLMPSNLFRGNLSKEELAKNLLVSRGTETNLGRILENPALSALYENILPNIPFSGANNAMLRTANAINQKSNNLVFDYLGNTSPLEVEERLGGALMKAYQNQSTIKNSLYKNAEDLADETGLNLDLSGFTQTAKKYSSIIADQNFLKYEPEAKSLLNRLTNFEKTPVDKSAILDSAGNAIETPRPTSLSEANMLAGKLGSLSKRYGASPSQEDRYAAGILGNLNKSLKGDIQGSIENSGNADLKDAFSAAESNYKDNFSKFLDKDVYKFIGGNKSAEDLISSFIKTGKNTDKGDQLNKLMSKLDPESQNLAKYSYFSRAIKGPEDAQYVDPQVLKNLWSKNSLGIKQKMALVPDKNERAQLDNLSKLVSLNPKAMNAMHNPPTGHALLSTIPYMMGTGLVGALSSHGDPDATLKGALMGLGGPAAARLATKALSSEALREKLIQKILEKQNQTSGKGGAIAALAQSLYEKSGSQ